MTYLQEIEHKELRNTFLCYSYFILLEEIELIMQAVSMEMMPQLGSNYKKYILGH